METTFRTLLVPLDGSPQAEAALPYATRLAACLQAELVLLRAALARTLPGVAPATAQVQVVSEAEDYLAALEARFRAAGISCRSVVPYGAAAESIVDNASLQAASLVVMSAHGHSGPSRWTHGGVADKVVQGLGAPVLLIQGPGGAPAAEQLGSVLLPLDGSELAEALLPAVALLASRLGVGVTLLSVVPPARAAEPAGAQATQAERWPSAGELEAAEYLQRVQEWLRGRGVEARVEVRVGNPAEAILDRSMADDVWLVVISSHGRSGVGRWVYGSVADRVLHQAERPVLLFRAPGAQTRTSQPVRARRCHNCGREVYRQTFSTSDLCPRCGFKLRACANCASYDGIVCKMDNPWSRSIYAGTPCADFVFRETVVTESTPSGK